MMTASLQEQERRIKTTAAVGTLIVSGGIFLLLLLPFFGQFAGPPSDEMGIEVNLGYDNVGYGTVQPDAPVGNDKPQPEQEQSSPASAPQEATEAVQETSTPVDATPVDPTPVATSDAESPVEIKEKKKKEEVKPVEKAPEKPKEKPVEPKVEKKEPVKEVRKDPVPDSKGAFKPGATTTTKTGGTASGKEGKPGNEGDDPGTVGDKGVPNGTPDRNGQYTGTPGGGNGGTESALKLRGWQWDEIPKPSIPNNETGRIVFEIEVDDNGELLGYKKISGGLSAAAERACVATLQKLTFSKESGAKVPPLSKGTITFVVRSE